MIDYILFPRRSSDMPYCPKCGAEHEEESKYCPKCGSDLLGPVETTYRRRRDPGWTVAAGLGRGVAAFIAFILLMAGAGMAVGGVAVLSGWKAVSLGVRWFARPALGGSPKFRSSDRSAA